jgi:hypothetical protein
MTAQPSINEILQQLSPAALEEVYNFAQQKLKEENTDDETIGFSWVGALKEHRDQFTSLELQKKSLDWWGD